MLNLYGIIYWVVCLIICLLLVFYIGLKLLFPFWCIQPVFHIYDLWYYFVSPKVITYKLPSIDQKYVNMKNIKVFYGNDAHIEEMTELVKNHYLRSKDLNYIPEKSHIVPYLTVKDVIILHYYYADRIIGTITLRSVECTISGVSLPMQYVDYLCVHGEHRKKGIAQQLISTLYYYQRHNTEYKVSLFKNEGKQRAIIPLTIYDSHRIILKKLPSLTIHPEYKFIKVTKKNIHTIHDTINNIKNDFTCCISVDISNLLLLITTGNIEVYYLTYKDTILSLYFVRNSQCYNKDNKIVKEIYATYKTRACSMEYFQNGFHLLLSSMYTYSPECIIENIGHSKWLLDWLTAKRFILSVKKYVVGYYLYNYIHKTIKSEDLFINL